MKQLDLFPKYIYSHIKVKVKKKKPKYDKYKGYHRWTTNKKDHYDLSYSDLSRGF
tara:strand:- start:931 stop:1095 length:165 start_codon:yes stop_codon:yes gene_type:complete